MQKPKSVNVPADCRRHDLTAGAGLCHDLSRPSALTIPIRTSRPAFEEWLALAGLLSIHTKLMPSVDKQAFWAQMPPTCLKDLYPW